MSARFFGWLALAAVISTVPATAFAADRQPKTRKVIRLDSLTVEGHIQKPQAFLLLQRSNLNFEELERTESFIPKVIKSVDKDPF
jgi:hypothetical protein